MEKNSTVISVSGTELESLTNQNNIVFVDFWATWCAPCRQFGAVFEQVAAKHQDIIFAKVNIEEEQALAETFHIQSIPHLMVFKKGIVIYSAAGSMPESTLIELVQQAVAADVSKILEEMHKEAP
jgi:thioredoxin 1